MALKVSDKVGPVAAVSSSCERAIYFDVSGSVDSVDSEKSPSVSVRLL